MLITPSTVSMLFQTFEGMYKDAYEKTPRWFEKVATKVQSNTSENVYAWLAMPKGFREWIGERNYNNLRVHGYVLRNKDWEDSVEIPRNAIMDDQYGVYSNAIQMLGVQSAKLYDYMIADALAAGTTEIGFDGQAFFSDSHPYNGTSTYDNNFASTALTSANYQAVRAAMMSYNGEDGKSLSIIPNLLIVPPQLEAQARQILNAEFTAPTGALGQNAANIQQTNVLRGSADLLVLPELSGAATTWYLADVSKPIKPLVLQERQAPTIQSPAEFPEHAFKTNNYIMGASARAVAGYSLPFLIARAIA